MELRVIIQKRILIAAAVFVVAGVCLCAALIAQQAEEKVQVESLRAVMKAMYARPAHVTDGLKDRGWVMHLLRHSREALILLDDAIAREKGDADAYCKRAFVHDALGHYELARKDAEMALKLDDREVDAYLFLRQ